MNAYICFLILLIIIVSGSFFGDRIYKSVRRTLKLLLNHTTYHHMCGSRTCIAYVIKDFMCLHVAIDCNLLLFCDFYFQTIILMGTGAMAVRYFRTKQRCQQLAMELAMVHTEPAMAVASSAPIGSVYDDAPNKVLIQVLWLSCNSSVRIWHSNVPIVFRRLVCNIVIYLTYTSHDGTFVPHHAFIVPHQYTFNTRSHKYWMYFKD